MSGYIRQNCPSTKQGSSIASIGTDGSVRILPTIKSIIKEDKKRLEHLKSGTARSRSSPQLPSSPPLPYRLMTSHSQRGGDRACHHTKERRPGNRLDPQCHRRPQEMYYGENYCDPNCLNDEGINNYTPSQMFDNLANTKHYRTDEMVDVSDCECCRVEQARHRDSCLYEGVQYSYQPESINTYTPSQLFDNLAKTQRYRPDEMGDDYECCRVEQARHRDSCLYDGVQHASQPENRCSYQSEIHQLQYQPENVERGQYPYASTERPSQKEFCSLPVANEKKTRLELNYSDTLGYLNTNRKLIDLMETSLHNKSSEYAKPSEQNDMIKQMISLQCHMDQLLKQLHSANKQGRASVTNSVINRGVQVQPSVPTPNEKYVTNAATSVSPSSANVGVQSTTQSTSKSVQVEQSISVGKRLLAAHTVKTPSQISATSGRSVDPSRQSSDSGFQERSTSKENKQRVQIQQINLNDSDDDFQTPNAPGSYTPHFSNSRVEERTQEGPDENQLRANEMSNVTLINIIAPSLPIIGNVGLTPSNQGSATSSRTGSANSIKSLHTKSANSVEPSLKGSANSVEPSLVSSTNSVEPSRKGSANSVEPSRKGSANSVEPSRKGSANSAEPSLVSSTNSVEPSRKGSANSVGSLRKGSANSVESSRKGSANSVEPSRIGSATSIKPSHISSANSVDPSRLGSPNIGTATQGNSAEPSHQSSVDVQKEIEDISPTLPLIEFDVKISHHNANQYDLFKSESGHDINAASKDDLNETEKISPPKDLSKHSIWVEEDSESDKEEEED